ncbi:MAG: RraA family protein [Bacteroidetes bacterium]|nr:RraA family protein [Bacteroidota bacterium]
MTDLTKNERLLNCYTGAVQDVLRNMGYPNQVLPHYLAPLQKAKIAGKIFTVEGKVDTSISKHDSLLSWCTMLSKAPGGKILVCQPNDHTIAHMGELSSETLMYKKVLGYVVDGGCRDVEFINKIGFPVYCKYFTPKDVVKTWKVTALGEPITIGDVNIRTDDYLLADTDGVILIPEKIIDEVIGQTEEVLRTENKVRTAILQGVDPVEAYLKFGKF